MAVDALKQLGKNNRKTKGILYLRNLDEKIKTRFKKWCDARGLTMDGAINALLGEVVGPQSKLAAEIIAAEHTRKILGIGHNF